MRALLDVNVLIALLDPDHASHQHAVPWFAEHAAGGWASCPITQNGCVRIMSHRSYPHFQSVQQITLRLREATSRPEHAFWPDDLSALDPLSIDIGRVHGPRQLTDVYLLALAVRQSGRLITFDRSIARDAVVGALPSHLVVL